MERKGVVSSRVIKNESKRGQREGCGRGAWEDQKGRVRRSNREVRMERWRETKWKGQHKEKWWWRNMNLIPPPSDMKTFMTSHKGPTMLQNLQQNWYYTITSMARGKNYVLYKILLLTHQLFRYKAWLKLFLSHLTGLCTVTITYRRIVSLFWSHFCKLASPYTMKLNMGTSTKI